MRRVDSDYFWELKQIPANLRTNDQAQRFRIANYECHNN